jgi:hypothetical protein
MQPSPPLAYLPGQNGEDPLPLGRFLPPLPAGIAAGSLERALPEAGGWVLDPFGSSPRSALELARCGRRVLVSAVNPVLVFLLDILASAPQPAEFQSALAALSAAKRGEERLEAHIRSLYHTPCASCGEEVEAEMFLWRRGETAPYARVYHCPHCQDEGEHPLSPQDRERVSPPGSDALHRSRALARVAGREDEHYPAVEEALTTYLPRPLYALQTLINKVEGPGFTPAQRRLLHALLLSACDAASTLWPSGGRTRPRQLSIPAQYRENNIWLALEQAAAYWSGQGPAVPLARAADAAELADAAGKLPSAGGILLFAGRARGLLPGEIKLSGGLAVFPRPNQAFWTLSALWAGWLWGREAALPLHPQLGRRRYDWNWHAGALHSPLGAAARLLPPGAPLVGLLPELAPGFLGAVLAASTAAGLKLDGLALRADEEQAQALWHVAPGGPPVGAVQASLGRDSEQIFAAGAVAALQERAEPCGYMPVYAAGLEALVQQGALPGPLPERAQLPGDLMTRIQTLTARVFSDRTLLRRIETGSQEDERSLWWLPGPSGGAAQTGPDGLRTTVPLADRVEMELVRLLQRSPGLGRSELDMGLCRSFPGLSTPPSELVAELLASYAEPLPGGGWKLQGAEMPAARRADLDEAREMLRRLGSHMGFDVSGETPIVWTPNRFGQVYYFYVIASSIISRHVLPALPAPAAQVVMVFPGGRAKLIAYKLRRDPRLAEVIKGVHLLKFRHLRALAERPGLTPELWDGLLDADPPFFEEAEQMQLL